MPEPRKHTFACDWFFEPAPTQAPYNVMEGGECNQPATHMIFQPLDDPGYDGLGADSMVSTYCEGHIVEQVHETRQCVGQDEAVFVIDIRDRVEQVN